MEQVKQEEMAPFVKQFPAPSPSFLPEFLGPSVVHTAPVLVEDECSHATVTMGQGH